MSQRQVKAARRAARRWNVDPASGIALEPQPHLEAASIRYHRELQKWVGDFVRWARMQVQMSQVMARVKITTDEDGMFVGTIREQSQIVGGQPGKVLFEFKSETPEDLVLQALLATGTGPVFRELPDGRTHVDRMTFTDTIDDVAPLGDPDVG